MFNKSSFTKLVPDQPKLLCDWETEFRAWNHRLVVSPLSGRLHKGSKIEQIFDFWTKNEPQTILEHEKFTFGLWLIFKTWANLVKWKPFCRIRRRLQTQNPFQAVYRWKGALQVSTKCTEVLLIRNRPQERVWLLFFNTFGLKIASATFRWKVLNKELRFCLFG